MDKFIFVSVISFCVSIILFEFGEQVFVRVIIVGLELDLIVCILFIDFYCKCGFVNLGRILFDGLVKFDEVCWNLMLVGYFVNGYVMEVLNLFVDMINVGV